jgi:hypothetical protein
MAAKVRASASRLPVIHRSRRGVTQEKPLAASHARIPLAPAAAVAAAAMHCAHID